MFWKAIDTALPNAWEGGDALALASPPKLTSTNETALIRLILALLCVDAPNNSGAACAGSGDRLGQRAVAGGAAALGLCARAAEPSQVFADGRVHLRIGSG
jgi:hypothetical protein